jgi:hypothetical protein
MKSILDKALLWTARFRHRLMWSKEARVSSRGVAPQHIHSLSTTLHGIDYGSCVSKSVFFLHQLLEIRAFMGKLP